MSTLEVTVMRLSPLLACVLLSAAPGLAAPMTLVSETFTPGEPTQLQYFGFSGPVPAVTDDGRLAVGYAVNGRFATSNFPRATLTYGDSLSVKFDISGTRSSTNTIVDFLLGFYDSRGTSPTDNSTASRSAAADDQGYVVTLRDDPANFYAGTSRIDFTGETLDGESGGFNGIYHFADGDTHTVELVYTLVRSTRASIAIYFDGVLRNTTQHSSIRTQFDNLQFGFGNRSLNNVRLDNLSVTLNTVPEPVTASWLAPAAAALACRRRRRQ